MNYFEFYEIPISFKVEEDELRRIFLRNSKKYHPDFYTLQSEAKQQEVLELSTLNNEAYKILADLDKRMKYVLELKEIPGTEGNNKIPQDFLMEMMDINEAVMELQFDFDQKAYDQAITNLKSLEEQNDQSVAILLDNYDDSSEAIDELKKIKDYYLKKRYLLRIRENLDKFASL